MKAFISEELCQVWTQDVNDGIESFLTRKGLKKIYMME
jgi:hypothetical protein